MSAEELVQRVGEATSRRKFLAKVSAGTLAFGFTLLGLPRPAEALVTYKCCHLCHNPSSSCSGACVWCWLCCYAGSHYNCCEYHSNKSYCGSGCTNVPCSRAILVTPCYKGCGCGAPTSPLQGDSGDAMLQGV
jgi:hypothetical protein